MAVLREHHLPFALIGAAALAAHGVARSTQDLDILVLDPVCLARSTWQPLSARGVTVDIRRGDETDPLGGIVRMLGRTALGMTAVIDVIVRRSPWQDEVLRRATPRLIEVGDRTAIVRHVESFLPRLSPQARALWARIVGSR